MPTNPCAGRDRAVFNALLLAIFALGMGLRFYRLDSSSLWLDEIFTATTAQLDVVSILRFHLEDAGNPPLLSLITHFFFAHWGQNEFVARLPSALLGSLSILLAYKLGETLWTREVGMTGAFLLAVNASHVRYSQEARHYALMVFLALLSLIFLLKALQGNKKGLWIGFVLCTALSLYNHYFAFLFLPAEVLFGAWVIAGQWLWHRRKGDGVAEAHQSGGLSFPARQALMFSVSLSVVGLSYLPWISALRSQFPKQLESPALGVSMASLQLSLNFLREVLVEQTGASGATLVLWLGLFLWGLVTCGQKRKVLVLVWMGASFAFLSVVEPSHPVRTRYVIFLLPIYLLVIARGVMSLSRLLNRAFVRMRGDGNRRLAFSHTLAVLILGALSVAPLRDYLSWQKEDWRSATEYLLENMASSDIIIADGQGYGGGADAGRTLSGLTYYFSLSGEGPTIFHAQRGLAGRLDEVVNHGASAWGVLWHTDRLGNLEQVSGEIEVNEFPRVAVIRVSDPHGDVLEDTASLLETLLLIQPRPRGRFDVHLALAEIYLKTGSLVHAASQAELAAAAAPMRESTTGLHPRWASAYSALGHTYQQLGRLELAVAAYEEALRIDPSYQPAQKSLDLLANPAEDVQHTLWRNLGGLVALLGYSIDPGTRQAGEPLHIALRWRALGKMDRDYTAFIHVIDQDGLIWAQQDRLLRYGEYTTSTWLPGEIVRGEYELRLPPDTPPGEYAIKVGIYYWETGERLPVWDEKGQRVADDTILLESIMVTR